MKRTLFVGLVLLFASYVDAKPVQAPLTYVRCKFGGIGDFNGTEANYYLDDKQERLLNDNKFAFGSTRQWSKEMVIVASESTNGAYITSINRITGELNTYLFHPGRLHRLQALSIVHGQVGHARTDRTAQG